MRMIFAMGGRCSALVIFWTMFSDVPRIKMRCGCDSSIALRTSSAWPGRMKMARRTAMILLCSFLAE